MSGQGTPGGHRPEAFFHRIPTVEAHNEISNPSRPVALAPDGWHAVGIGGVRVGSGRTNDNPMIAPLLQMPVTRGALAGARYTATDIEFIDARHARLHLDWHAPDGTTLASREVSVDYADGLRSVFPARVSHADPVDGDATEGFLWLRRQSEHDEPPALRAITRDVALAYARLMALVTRAAVRAAADPGVGDRPPVAVGWGT